MKNEKMKGFVLGVLASLMVFTLAGGALAASGLTITVDPSVRIRVNGKAFQPTDVQGNAVMVFTYNGTTYAPLRALAEAYGLTVGYDAASNMVTVSAPSSGTAPAAPDAPAAGSLISAEDAKAKALAHAGLSAGEVTFIQSKLDWEDGRQVYDVEFYTADYKEYDYEIDAVTGAVVSFDQDAEGYTPPAGGAVISEARAREIALTKVPGASDSHIRELKLDRDDGRQIYEVEIVYNRVEYEIEIDAVTGNVLKYDPD